jgi:DNA-binding NarL/FixJ family response regulator
MRIVLVDDHTLFRMGVRHVLTNTPGHEVVGEASTARSAFRIVDALGPDVVLMDIAMPGMDGVVATREILRRAPHIRVLVLSAHEQMQDVKDALDAGALGYALKGDPPETLEKALASVASRVRYLSPRLRARVLSVERERPSADDLGVLSEREREIFRLAADCRTSPEIARQLCIARKTVDTHINRINHKLHLRDRAELVRLAARVGLVHAIRPQSWHIPVS